MTRPRPGRARSCRPSRPWSWPCGSPQRNRGCVLPPARRPPRTPPGVESTARSAPLARIAVAGVTMVIVQASCSKSSSPADDAGRSASSATASASAGPPNTAVGVPDGSTSDAPPDASATPDATPSAEDGGAAACPAGMILIDGDYCTSLELSCKKSWYAKWNDKTICEEFEEPSKCTGKTVHKRFCIDTYEYPNKKGERPRV